MAADRDAASRQPIYPIYLVRANWNWNWGDPDELETVGESEMIGNIFNQAGKALEGGATRVVIELTESVVDARVPGH